MFFFIIHDREAGIDIKEELSSENKKEKYTTRSTTVYYVGLTTDEEIRTGQHASILKEYQKAKEAFIKDPARNKDPSKVPKFKRSIIYYKTGRILYVTFITIQFKSEVSILYCHTLENLTTKYVHFLPKEKRKGFQRQRTSNRQHNDIKLPNQCYPKNAVAYQIPHKGIRRTKRRNASWFFSEQTSESVHVSS